MRIAETSMPSTENWVAAVEEALALQSILQANFRCWLNESEVQLSPEAAEELIDEGPLGRRLMCSASVHIALPNPGISVQEVPSSHSAETSNGHADAMKLQHLPPICLQMCIPPSYPQQDPPHCQLFSEWLSPRQIRILHQHLEDLWTQQGPGLPIGFSWIDWLQNEALTCLGLQDGILLGHQESPVSEDGSSDSGAEQSSLDHTKDVSAPHDGRASSMQQAAQGSKGQQSKDAFELGAHSGSNGFASRARSHEVASSGQPAGPAQALLSSQAILARLVAYDAMRKTEIFKEGFHLCAICMEEKHGAQFTWPATCQHALCGDCTQQLSSLHVAEGSLEQLCCPMPDCRAPFSRQRLSGVLSAEELTRWEDLELSQSLQRMPDVVYCPRCSAACLEDGDNCAQCSKCFYAFCSLCDESWHPGIQCVTAETKLDMLRERMAGNKDCGAELRRKEQDYLSLLSIQKTSKRCPVCGMAIVKSEGCNKMTCSNCGAYFCWRCNKRVEGYEHFRNGTCILFEVPEIAAWEMQWEAHMERAQAQFRNDFWRQLAGPEAHVSACPLCGQNNTKVQQNNHVRCWACAGHYCYKCRKPLRGAKGESGLHFGKGKCKQHSND